jgi:hypothetical protein
MSTDRKQFAAIASKNRLSGILFSWYDDKKITVAEFLIKHCTTQTRVDEMRWILGAQFNGKDSNE